MTDDIDNELDGVLDDLIVFGGEQDIEAAKQSLHQLIQYLLEEERRDYKILVNTILEAKENELRNARVDPFEFVESCEENCTDVRHAYHQGQWDMATRIWHSYHLESEHIEHITKVSRSSDDIDKQLNFIYTIIKTGGYVVEGESINFTKEDFKQSLHQLINEEKIKELRDLLEHNVVFGDDDFYDYAVLSDFIEKRIEQLKEKE